MQPTPRRHPSGPPMLGGGKAEDEEANPALGYSLEDDGSRAWDDSRPSRELVEAFGVALGAELLS